MKVRYKTRDHISQDETEAEGNKMMAVMSNT